MILEEVRVIEAQMEALDQEMARLLAAHQDAVQRLAAVPDWVSIRHSRSSRKSAPRPPPFRPRSISRPGSGPVPVTRRARA